VDIQGTARGPLAPADHPAGDASIRYRTLPVQPSHGPRHAVRAGRATPGAGRFLQGMGCGLRARRGARASDHRSPFGRRIAGGGVGRKRPPECRGRLADRTRTKRVRGEQRLRRLAGCRGLPGPAARAAAGPRCARGSTDARRPRAVLGKMPLARTMRWARCWRRRSPSTFRAPCSARSPRWPAR
jgi:hypothetical protein